MATATHPAGATTEAAELQAALEPNQGKFHWKFALIIGIFHLGALGASVRVSLVRLGGLCRDLGLNPECGDRLGLPSLADPSRVRGGQVAGVHDGDHGHHGPAGQPRLLLAAVHRLHHQFTDKPGDPHSPRDGKWWSHMGWILNGSLHNDSGILKRYAPDLMKQGFYRWLNRFHWLPVTVLGFGLLAAGGWPWVLWGIFLRVTIGLHVTWLVNSATHIWGSRRFDTRDDSRNNWWVALLTGGEGWHNNHHAHPVSARHGMAWYELDVNYLGIWMLEKVGLATKVNAKRV